MAADRHSPGTPGQAPARQKPGVLVSLLLVLSVVPFMAILYGLFALFHITQPWFGYLFLVYWAAILQQQPAEFVPAVFGGAGGIGLAWALFAWPAFGGVAGEIAAGLLLGATLFCFMRGLVRLLVNNALMLFLMVATIPSLHVADTALAMIAALAIAAAYMGGVAVISRAITTRRLRALTAPPQAERGATPR